MGRGGKKGTKGGQCSWSECEGREARLEERQGQRAQDAPQPAGENGWDAGWEGRQKEAALGCCVGTRTLGGFPPPLAGV